MHYFMFFLQFFRKGQKYKLSAAEGLEPALLTYAGIQKLRMYIYINSHNFV